MVGDVLILPIGAFGIFIIGTGLSSSVRFSDGLDVISSFGGISKENFSVPVGEFIWFNESFKVSNNVGALYQIVKNHF